MDGVGRTQGAEREISSDDLMFILSPMKHVHSSSREVATAVACDRLGISHGMCCGSVPKLVCDGGIRRPQSAVGLRTKIRGKTSKSISTQARMHTQDPHKCLSAHSHACMCAHSCQEQAFQASKPANKTATGCEGRRCDAKSWRWRAMHGFLLVWFQTVLALRDSCLH